jgi:2-succinyl-5-enolpyruvyl-6-hydroxy-3-cyclohexene-1-carboxylate synthase
VSTAIGAALASGGDDRPTVAFLGDLTFLHDLTGLVIGPHEPRSDLTFVISNNDGGAIFSTLESGDPRHARAFDRVFGTPHGVQLAGIAEACGVEHVLVSTGDELGEAVAQPAGIRIVEVPTSRTELAATLARMTAEVTLAIRG